MKSKTTAAIFLIFAVILIAACNQAKKQEQVTQRPESPATATPEATTGNAAVDSVGQDISNVDSIEKDLNTDQLDDIDAGLEDIQNI